MTDATGAAGATVAVTANAAAARISRRGATRFIGSFRGRLGGRAVGSLRHGAATSAWLVAASGGGDAGGDDGCGTVYRRRLAGSMAPLSRRWSLALRAVAVATRRWLAIAVSVGRSAPAVSRPWAMASSMREATCIA